MKHIKLSQGLFATVDDADFEWLNQWHWTAMKKGPRSKGHYAYRQEGKRDSRRTIVMHRFILNTPEGLDTDHIDNDGLNNQRSNLRAVDRTQNNYNTGLRCNNTSGYRGISWSKRVKAWRVFIGGSKTRKELGHYKDLAKAVKVRLAAENEVIQ